MGKSPSEKSLARMEKLVDNYTKKSGTTTHPDKTITEAVVLGLARHVDELGRPLCPCVSTPTSKKRSSIGHGSARATTCRSTNTVMS